MKYITLDYLLDETQNSINRTNKKNSSFLIKNLHIKMKSFISHNENGVLIYIHDFSNHEEYSIPEYLISEIEFEVDINLNEYYQMLNNKES